MSRDELVNLVRAREQREYRANKNYWLMARIRAAITRVHALTDYGNPADVKRRSALVRLLNAKHQVLYQKGMVA